MRFFIELIAIKLSIYRYIIFSMTYTEFVQNFINNILKIKSFSGRVDYAKQHLGNPIGSGSGRIVFDIDGDKVLKLAKNAKGVAQNNAEASTGRYADTHHIVTKVIDSADDDSWVISEKAKKVTEKRIKELTGIPSLFDLSTHLRNEIDKLKGNRNNRLYASKFTEDLYNNEFVVDLLDFAINYNQNVGDMGRPSTYGEVIHDGHPAIVLTDYGLNDEVYDTYYSPKRKMYELYNYSDGNDDILSDISDVGEVRHNMWALIPQGVGDGDVPMDEEFINYVSNRNKYPNTNISNISYLLDKYHECVNNIKETLKHVVDKDKFYGNLLSLQEYLISQNQYDRDKLGVELFHVNENNVTPKVIGYSLDDKNHATELVKSVSDKLGFKILNYLGGGSNGFAFDIGNNKVFKISSDVGEADAAAKLLRANPKFIAKVYNLYKIVDTEKNLSYFGIIEQNIVDKPIDKLKRLNNVISIIKPFDLSVVDFYILMSKKTYDYNKMVEYAKGILTENPDANVSSAERNEAYEYMIGLFNIKNELISLNIKSNDYSNIQNLGYDNGVLKYFDFGGYRSEEPNIGDANTVFLQEYVENSNFNKDNSLIIAKRISEKYDLGNPIYYGSGEHGFAFDLGNNKILKVTQDKTEAVESLKIKGKSLKHLAEIFAVFEVSSKIGNDIPHSYVIISEKLNINQPYFDRMVDRLDFAFEKILGLDFVHVLDDYIYGEYDDKKEMIDKYLSKNPEDAKYYYDLLGIADEVRKFGIESNDFYNTSNLGYKQDGSLGFFDMGFGDDNFNSKNQPKKVQIEEDSTSKFSTNSSIGRDEFPSYEQNDTSMMIDNNIPTSVDDIVERIVSSMVGSNTVEVKKKCKLGGNGNTSTACNQGDIKNLKIKAIDEEINAREAYGDDGALKAMVNGRKDVSLIALKFVEPTLLELINKHDYGIIPVVENPHDVDMSIVFRKTIRGKSNAMKLHEIMKRHGGFVADKTPKEAYEIGKLLDYSDSSIMEYINRVYKKNKNGQYVKRNPDELTAFDKSMQINNEGVADVYAEKEFNIKPEFSEFNNSNHNENDEHTIIYSNNDLKILKNPKTLSNIGPYVRAIADINGNLYVEQKIGINHDDMIKILDKLNIINYIPLWYKKQPDRFISLQRVGNSNTFALGESNVLMFPHYINYYAETKSNYLKILNKVIANNPNIRFINEVLQYVGEYNDENSETEDNLDIFAENNNLKLDEFSMNEAQLMSLQDLPFKNEIEQLGGKIFSVGGAVRDEFLGKESKDLDILITGIPMNELEVLLSKYGRVDAVGKSFGVLKFKPKGVNDDIDIAIPRTEKTNDVGGHKGFDVTSDHALPIEKDLERRDFTINAIAKDVDGNIIDPFGGQEDLKNKIIRIVNPEAFSDDPLRMLRAVQFATRFGFTIEPKTMKMIQDNAARVVEIPPERVLTEFDKIVKKGNPAIGAQLLIETGLFQQIFGKPKKISGLFNNVKTMGEFIYLLCSGSINNPSEFFKNKLRGDIETYKEIKALEIAFKYGESINNVEARTVAHNMFVTSQQSLNSEIIPNVIKIAALELLQGKYPKTVNELTVNGNDLVALGFKGKEIGDAQKMMLLKIYSNDVNNVKDDLIKLIRNNVINENNESTDDYGYLMLSLDIPNWKSLTTLINPDDLYDEIGYGVENNPHVTILYGFHDSVDVKNVFKTYVDNFEIKPLKLKVDGISIFENDDFDVVKIDVNPSSTLIDINTMMRKFPHTSTYDEYHPHITIAYVKKGAGNKYIKKFKNDYIVTGDELVYSEQMHDDSPNRLILNIDESVDDLWIINGENVGIDFFVREYDKWNNIGGNVGYVDPSKASVLEFIQNNYEDFTHDEKLKSELLRILSDCEVLTESKSKSKYQKTKESLYRSKSISKEMKDMISKYLNGGSTYHEGGRIHGLMKPKEFTNKTPKSVGVSLGADKNGFYVYTHRAASKRYDSPELISIKSIEFIESTG